MNDNNSLITVIKLLYTDTTGSCAKPKSGVLWHPYCNVAASHSTGRLDGHIKNAGGLQQIAGGDQSQASGMFVCMWCLSLPAGMPRSGKLPVLFLLIGQKSGFSPRRSDLLHRFRSNFAGPTGTWVRLAVQNFTSIDAEGWECGPKYQKFPLFGKEATPLTDFENF